MILDLSEDELRIAAEEWKRERDEALRELELKKKWFEEYMDLENFAFNQKIWDERDVDTENPMKTLRNGLERYVRTHAPISCAHQWKNGPEDERHCTQPDCGLTQVWHPDGHFNDK